MDSITLSLFDSLAASEQQALADTFRSRHESIAETNRLLVNTAAEVQRRGWNTHLPIWNACLFLNTIAYDHSVLFFDLVYEKDYWKRRLVARNLCVLLFETAEDLPTVFGQRFNKSLMDLQVRDDIVRTFRTELKKVSLFWDSHREFLKSIRTVCGAHREHDAIALNDAIDALDLLQVFHLSLDLGNILRSIGQAAQVIISATSAIQPPELSAPQSPL